jgi:asparagine synthase (glutamine-hydrolysing)
VSAFAGIVRFDASTGDSDLEEILSRTIAARHKERIRTFRAPGAALFAAGGETSVQPVAGDRCMLIASLARLDNRKELGATLGISVPASAQAADAWLLMQVFERWGEAGIARCLGAFVLAQWDPQKRRLTLARDYIGFNHTLFFYRGRGFVVFSTVLQTLLSLSCVPREIDDVMLADFLAVNFTEMRRTFYRGVEHVPTRTLVTIDHDQVCHRSYWSPDFAAPAPYRRDQDYIERARELFDQAVAAAIDGQRRIAISASGGLDSSAIAATAARLGRAESITCYTLVPPAHRPTLVRPNEYADETSKMRALAAMYPGLDVRLLAPEEPHAFEQDHNRIFAALAMPIYDPANFGWFGHLRDAVSKDGHRTLLEGALGNFGLTWHGTFALFSLLRQGKWRAFARELRLTASEQDQNLARTFLSHIVIANSPAPMRRAVHRLRGRDPRSVAHYSALSPDFIADHDLPRRWSDMGFDPWFHFSGWRPAQWRAFRLFDQNQIVRDMRSQFERQVDFETRQPHADRRLLEFALSVPEWLYRRDGITRWFARAVFADRLPREILNERLRGAQSGAWFNRLNVSRLVVAEDVERFESSPLARRLIDLPRLKRLVGDWPNTDEMAHARMSDYRFALSRAIHVGRFIRWVEGGNA